MAELVLKAETGREIGTRESRRLRREGKVPAVVYGLSDDPLSVSVEWPLLRKAITTEAGLNALITLEIDGDRQLSIVKDLQRHPVRRDVIHVDFIRIDANVELEVEVPIQLVGESRELIAKSGMVDHMMHSLTVLSRPASIPTEFEVDISDLNVGDSIRVIDVVLPDGVRTEVDPEEAIASGVVTRSTLEEMRREEEAAEEAEAAEFVSGDDGDGDGEGEPEAGDGDD
ncbi:MAG: 50S ribosomal protein L25 [Acidobacteria bacterium]|nr:50S ribosomal protein L25 [Acidobacteriota bacterium]